MTDIFNTTLSPNAKTEPYQCLVETEDKNMSRANAIAKILIELYGKRSMSITKWKKFCPIQVKWFKNPKDHSVLETSRPITFNLLAKHLASKRKLDHLSLNLPEPHKYNDANWMDRGFTMFHQYVPYTESERSMEVVLPTLLGDSFPIKPTLDREGFLSSTLQLPLQKSLIKARRQLIDGSSQFVPQKIDRIKGPVSFRFQEGDAPISDLMTLFNLVVSLVDISLIQTYYAAKYSGVLYGLQFDEKKLGPTIGRRLKDKLKWVKIISGNYLNAKDEIKSFNRLKSIRNHLAHFDPPCISISIDDIAEWLSLLPDVAWLLIKIRTCLGISISGPLAELAIAKKIISVPRDPNLPRYPQSSNVGYASSVFRKQSKNEPGIESYAIPEESVSGLIELGQRISSITGQNIEKSKLVEFALMNGFSRISFMDDDELKTEIDKL